MNKKTRDKILEKIKKDKESGDMLPSKALLSPKSEKDLLKKNMCEVFTNFVINNNDEDHDKLSKIIKSPKKEALKITGYYIEEFTVDFLFDKLVLLSKVDMDAKKSLARIMLT